MSRVNFVVLTSSRTGSSWLIDLLNMQKGVEAHGELFLEHGRLGPAIAGRSDFRRFVEVHGSPGLSRVVRVVSYLNALYRGSSAVGFKLMYTQLRRFPEILAYLAMRHVRVVHLTRRNHIDVMISEEIAKLTGVSHVRTGTNPVVPMVRLDPVTLIDRMHRRNRRPREARLLIRFTACPILEVSYEALLGGGQEFARILEFLDIPGPSTPVVSNLAKRGTRSHRDAIVNYEEVREILSSTPFSSMLR